MHNSSGYFSVSNGRFLAVFGTYPEPTVAKPASSAEFNNVRACAVWRSDVRACTHACFMGAVTGSPRVRVYRPMAVEYHLDPAGVYFICVSNSGTCMY